MVYTEEFFFSAFLIRGISSAEFASVTELLKAWGLHAL